MLPSTVTDSDVPELQRGIGLELPPFYLAFLWCRAALTFDFGDYSLPSLWPNDP